MHGEANIVAATLSVTAGLLALTGGAELLVRGAVASARRLRVSPLLIGITVVGFGTSTPELTASVTAAIEGSPGIAIGNVVGSNIVNILLILGLAALIAPIATTRRTFTRDGATLIGVSVLCAAACRYGVLDAWIGVVFLVLLAAYLGLSFRLDGRAETAAGEPSAAAVADAPPPLGRSAFITLGGFAAVIVGAALLVDGAITLARVFGVSDAVIGLTVVAVGTSLPELATSVVAALRRQADVAFGNILGSNIFNILGILGVASLVAPLPVPARIADFDVWLMLAATAVAVVFAATGWRITRWEGSVLLVAYTVYLAMLILPLGSTPSGLP